LRSDADAKSDDKPSDILTPGDNVDKLAELATLVSDVFSVVAVVRLSSSLEE
jgi:hypothetical protein